ncbi:MAG: DUF5615 family PIN-like protein [Trichormus sp.]
MKLLIDENISDRIIAQIADIYPNSTHVKLLALTQSDDLLIWEYAKAHDFVIVSKDSDFHQRSLVYGHPPKLCKYYGKITPQLAFLTMHSKKVL